MTSASAPKTIDLGGPSVQREAIASATIKPGMLIQRHGSAGEVRPHAQAGGIAAAMFAVENEAVGRGIGDDYSDDDQVIFREFAEGAYVYAWLASGQNVAENALLTSNADGRLKVAGNTDFVVARAREAVDATAAAARIKTEVLKGRNAAGGA